MNNLILQAHKLIKEANGNFDISGGKDEVTISKLEKILLVQLPTSYKNFLKIFGWLGLSSFEFYGLVDNQHEEILKSGVAWINLKFRSDFKMPNNIFIFNERGDGSCYALDLSQMNANNECPVVVWPLNGYEDTPVLEVVAKDFGEFFLDMVKREIAMKD